MHHLLAIKFSKFF